MKLLARAKINWDLRVLGKRPDGYHELDTVMVTVDLADEVRFEPHAEFVLSCSDPVLPCDNRNLVYQAAELLAASANIRPTGRVHIRKTVPMGGGLGGGSSDAAAALMGLNILWGLQLPREHLLEIAPKIGADVSFFLHGGWCRCRGRGEIVEPLPKSAAFQAITLLLVIPPLSVSTPEVYRAFIAAPYDGQKCHRILTAAEKEVHLEIEKLNAGAGGCWPDNELIPAAQAVEPQLRGVAAALERSFPGRWQMSGSGAVHLVAPPIGVTLRDAAERLRRELPWPVRVLETRTGTQETGFSAKGGRRRKP
jgi:4-diphosphocytidyl-2C-methyl-D-erythritol kinase